MQLPATPAPGAPLEAEWGRQVIDYLRALTPAPSPHIRPAMDTGGTTYKLTAPPTRTPSGFTSPHPWHATRADTLDEAEPPNPVPRIRLHPGSIDGLVPTNIFAPLTITGTGMEYVLVTIATASGRLVSATLSVSAIVPDTPIPSQDAPPDALVDILAIIKDGIIYQIRKGNLQAISQIVMDAPNAIAEPWRDNLLRFYRWGIQESI